jgi:hypothetical protein
MEWWLIYLLTGAFVGFFAGLLGIGGGLILVPVLITVFTAQDFPVDRIMHMALGTTMATIIFTSITSLRTHHQHGAVNWQIVRNITPGIFLGTFGGATLAGSMTGQLLSSIFCHFYFLCRHADAAAISPQPDVSVTWKNRLVTRRRSYWRTFQSGCYWWRVIVNTISYFVQNQTSTRYWHCSRHRFSHRLGRNHRLCLKWIDSTGSTSCQQFRICSFTRINLAGIRQYVDSTSWCKTYAFDPNRHSKNNLCCIAL